MGYFGGSDAEQEFWMGAPSGYKMEEMLNPEQLAYRNSLLQQFTPGQSFTPYSGQIAPGASQLQQQAFGLGGQIGPGSTMFGDQYGAMQQAMSGQPAFEIDPAARQSVYDAERNVAMNEFNDIGRGIAEQYNMGGLGRSGGFNRSLSRAGGLLSDQLSARYSGLAYQDEQDRRASMENAANRSMTAAGQMNTMQQNDLTMMANLGGQQRQIQGEQNQEEYNKWLSSQPEFHPWLNYMGQALAPTQAVIQESGSSGLLGGLGGG